MFLAHRATSSHDQRPHNPYVVLDLASHVDDVTLEVLRLANLVLLILVPDIPSVKNAQAFLRGMAAEGVSPDNMMLVLNKVERKGGLKGEHVLKALQRPVQAEIPLERKLVLQAINRGEPLLYGTKTNPLARPLLELAGAVKERLAAREAESGN